MSVIADRVRVIRCRERVCVARQREIMRVLREVGRSDYEAGSTRLLEHRIVGAGLVKSNRHAVPKIWHRATDVRGGVA